MNREELYLVSEREKDLIDQYRISLYFDFIV